jgi:hypothetical protein
MDGRELQRWELPGYWAYAHDEPFPRVWAVLWSLWGLTVAGLITWSDGAYAVGGCFVAWGTFMGCFGWRTLTVGMAVIHDWAKSHCTDPKVEMAAMCEMIKASDLAREQGEWDEENWEMPDTPVQRQWTRDELFTVSFSIPWLMGLIHGVGVGGLSGAVLALVPGSGFSVTTGAVSGALGGAVAITFLFAVFFGLLPLPKDSLPVPWSLRQLMLFVVSPLLAVPALVEAAILWGRWYSRKPSVDR